MPKLGASAARNSSRLAGALPQNIVLQARPMRRLIGTARSGAAPGQHPRREEQGPPSIIVSPKQFVRIRALKMNPPPNASTEMIAVSCSNLLSETEARARWRGASAHRSR